MASHLPLGQLPEGRAVEMDGGPIFIPDDSTDPEARFIASFRQEGQRFFLTCARPSSYLTSFNRARGRTVPQRSHVKVSAMTILPRIDRERSAVQQVANSLASGYARPENPGSASF
jgi:hypothetical protein